MSQSGGPRKIISESGDPKKLFEVLRRNEGQYLSFMGKGFRVPKWWGLKNQCLQLGIYRGFAVSGRLRKCRLNLG